MPRAFRTTILPPTPANLRRMARVLARGGLVGVPTETVYGLAANALEPSACHAIFRAKGRPRTDPLIVHVLGLRDAEVLAEFNPPARRLVQAFWPGPLTLVLPKRSVVPKVVTAGGPTVAIRAPRHPVMRRLLRLLELPLAAPSANPFGYISPTTAEHVRECLDGKVRCVIDGGASRVGVESTIVDLTVPDSPRILRSGGITAAQIERVLGVPVTSASRASTVRRRQAAPGMLTQHYSPYTALRLHEQISPALMRAAEPGAAFLLFRRPRGGIPTGVRAYVLSPAGKLEDAARRLYAGLHELDHAGFHQLHAELAPERGAGIAINDRLRRAAAKHRTP